MKKSAAVLVIACVVVLTGPAAAELCTIDARPAATLLVPSFFVDLDDPGGLTTLFSVNNAASSPQLAHVTVWTDWSVPVFDFDIYLSGYDIVTINMRDLLAGTLPQTGAGAPWGVAIPGTNQGLYSQPNTDFLSCNNSSASGAGPYYGIPAFGAAFRAHVEAWLTGQASPLFGNCAGSDKNNNIATGYVTIDNTNDCSLLFPSDHNEATGPWYFGPTGFATDHNVLWGDYFFVNAGEALAQGDTVVHIEASPIFESVASPSVENITFYGRYVDGAVGIDHREPLPTTLGSRYIIHDASNIGTDLVVWRSAETNTPETVACGGSPSWAGLNQRESIIFDENENPIIITEDDCISGDPTCDIEVGNLFPWETQVRTVDENPPFEIQPGWECGWLYLNLNHNRPGNVYGDRAQAWVTPLYSAEDRFSIGLSAVQLDNACRPNDFVIAVDNFVTP